jgi:hypothetical protein
MSSITEWQDATRARIRLVQDGLLATRALRASHPEHDALIEMMERPYLEILEEMYAEDLSLAKLVDESDLLVHLKGPAASAPTPKISVLTKALTSTRDQVTRLAKQLGGVRSQRVPAALDMNFVGLARGSLFVGFSAGDSSEDGQLTRSAVTLIGEASALVSEDAPLERVASTFDDPAERDIAVAAIRQLSPSGQSGLSEVDLFGRAVPRSVQLTTQTRRHARMLMAQPAPNLISVQEDAEFVGTVREVDLDEHRFDLRNIDGYPFDIRCAHELDESEVQALMNRRTRVRGKLEVGRTDRRRPGGVRLLWVDEAELLR